MGIKSESLRKLQAFSSEFLSSGAIIGLDAEHVLIGWGPRQWSSSSKENEVCSFYFPDFFLENPNPWCAHENQAVISKAELQSTLQTNFTSPKLSMQWVPPQKPLFDEIFCDLKKQLEDGVLKKAVPFVYESMHNAISSEQLRSSLISALNYAQCSPVHLYGFWDQYSGMLGATPEILFSTCSGDPESLETVACAGTRKIDGFSRAGFVSDLKESYEHQLVIDGIKESLVDIGKVTIGELEVLELPTLVHLLTPIKVKTGKDVIFEEVVKALHPTPALGTYPREEGLLWLKNYEKKVQRRCFGAPAGFIFNGGERQACYVAIRNVQWENGKTYLCAGCGVVKESQQDREWEEILLKIKAIKNVLAL